VKGGNASRKGLLNNGFKIRTKSRDGSCLFVIDFAKGKRGRRRGRRGQADPCLDHSTGKVVDQIQP